MRGYRYAAARLCRPLRLPTEEDEEQEVLGANKGGDIDAVTFVSAEQVNHWQQRMYKVLTLGIRFLICFNPFYPNCFEAYTEIRTSLCSTFEVSILPKRVGSLNMVNMAKESLQFIVILWGSGMDQVSYKKAQGYGHVHVFSGMCLTRFGPLKHSKTSKCPDLLITVCLLTLRKFAYKWRLVRYSLLKWCFS